MNLPTNRWSLYRTAHEAALSQQVWRGFTEAAQVSERPAAARSAERRILATESRAAPLDEMVIGIKFRPLKLLTLAHVGVFWSSISRRYPRAEHAPPIFDAPDDPHVGLPPPRLWFLDASGAKLLQFQTDRFVLNWRRRPDGPEYPSFSSMQHEFLELWEAYLTYLERAELGIIEDPACELSYINVIDDRTGWSGSPDATDLTQCVRWNLPSGQNPLGRLRSVGWHIAYEIEENGGSFSASLRHGTRKVDQHPVLRLDLTASGPVSSASRADLERWLAPAHAASSFAFDLIWRSGASAS